MQPDSPRSFVDDPAVGAELDQLDRGLIDDNPLDTEQPHSTRLLTRLRGISPAPADPASVSVPVPVAVSEPRQDAGAAPPDASRNHPDFFSRLGATLDTLDHLTDSAGGTSTPDDAGLVMRASLATAHVTPSDDHARLLTRAVHVIVFIVFMGIGALAAAFVFHDRLSQIL